VQDVGQDLQCGGPGLLGGVAAGVLQDRRLLDEACGAAVLIGADGEPAR
jgi:hypothetical protein